MILDGAILLKYEDSDILAFISDKSKKEHATQISLDVAENGEFEQIPEEDNFENKTRDKVINSLKGAFNKDTVLTSEAHSFFPDPSMESQSVKLSEKEFFPFETFEGYDGGALNPFSSPEAFGIVTTGIDPLEITPSGAVITGFITSSRRNELRLGTYVVLPYEWRPTFCSCR